MRLLPWVALAGLAGVLAAPTPGAACAANPPPRPIRYLSLNILHGGILSGLSGDDEHLEARFHIIVDELRALDADVVGIQEASVSRRRGDVAARLAAELGYHHVYAPVPYFSANWLNRLTAWVINLEEGQAILSRFPILDWEAAPLPLCKGRFDPRLWLYARLQTPWGELGVASTHTSNGFCEAPAVAGLMHDRRGPLPSVLMGDFNATDDSPGVTALTVGGGFIDAFRAVNPTAAGLTVWQRVDAPAPTVRRRVDFVFVLPGTRVPGQVRSSRVVLDAPRQLPDGMVLWPSDHYGVLAEVEVFPSTPGPTATPDGR
jgi:endonuclease/exonuclease/phosphatase family metal-dependent hydrolase